MTDALPGARGAMRWALGRARLVVGLAPWLALAALTDCRRSDSAEVGGSGTTTGLHHVLPPVPVTRIVHDATASGAGDLQGRAAVVGRATVMPDGGAATGPPALAFDTDRLAFDLPFGEEQVKRVRLTGVRAAEAHITIKDPSDVGFQIELVHGEPDAGAGPGLEIRAHGGRVGVRVGNIVLATGLDEPKEILLPYSCKVVGTLMVSPAEPRFDLHAEGPKTQVIDVRSAQPDFNILAVDVAEGPFMAAFAPAAEDGGAGAGAFRVKVTLSEDRLGDDPHAALGKLVILSNDHTEPSREVSLVGFGTLSRARDGGKKPR